MDRARRAGWTALIVALLTSSLGGVGLPVLAAAVSWPTSTLVVSEVQTGGASASDEFVEIANQGAASIDLVGLELVYATSSGSTVTRKASWDASTVLPPGRRLLVANSAGSLATLADVVYSGGFAATGGALALRVVGGSVVDSVGWGDATNGFVEGTAVAASPAGSSVERRPGAVAGNATDSNDNVSDWFVQTSPSPQGFAAPPVPNSTPTPSPTPQATPTPTPTPAPTPPPTPTPSPAPTPAPTPTPTPAPTPTPSPTPAPTPTPTESPIPIATVRTLADGTAVTVKGVLTTSLGSLESGRGGFVQDESGGIAIYLDAAAVGAWPAGTMVLVRGTTASRFSQRTLKLGESAIDIAGTGGLPAPFQIVTGNATEPLEGARVSVTGTVTGAPDTLADGLGITIDDGSGDVRAVIGPDAVAGRVIGTGMTATVTGPLGQRDSSGTGAAGYRIHATLDGELILAEPTPTPSPTPEASPTPTPTPEATPTPDPTPSPTPGDIATIAAARGLPAGARVTVEATVTAEIGRLGTAGLIAVADATGGLAVRLPNQASGYPRGTLLRVTGTLAVPYGQLEIKTLADGITVLGTAVLPEPISVPAAGLDESLESRLVTATGTVASKPRRSSGGDLTIVLESAAGLAVKVIADSTSEVTADAFRIGSTYRLTGVVGQRASKKGAPDGYRICMRDPADVSFLGTAAPSSDEDDGDSQSAGDDRLVGLATIRISAAFARVDQAVAIEAIVTAPATLLDATGRRIVVQDASGAIEVLLPSGAAAPAVGTRLHIQGHVGQAYGAPRLRADAVTTLGNGQPPEPLTLRATPTGAHEWRLVTFSGRIDDVRKLGDRWRAEVLLGGNRVVVVGQPGAGIDVAMLAEGQMVRVTGVVRRAHPTASDQRFAVTPRDRGDLRVLGAPTTDSRSSQGSTGAATTGPGTRRPRSASGAGSEPPDGTIDADLVDLVAHRGRTVRVGGLVVDLRTDGVWLDDGTLVGLVVLRGSALEVLPLLEPDDAINAIGRVEVLTDGPAVIVDDPAGIIRAGDPVAEALVQPGEAVGTQPSAPAASQAFASAPPHLAGLADTPSGIGAGLAGLGTLIVLSVVSLAFKVGRTVHARRRAEARIAARVAEFAAAADLSGRPRSVEHDGRPFHSA